MYRKLIVYIIIFILIVTLTACGVVTNPEPQPSTELDLAVKQEAELIYRNRCISCHGSEFQGRMGDASNLQKVGSRRSYDEIITTIKSGKGLMPAQEDYLSDQEIQALGKWLSTKK